MSRTRCSVASRVFTVGIAAVEYEGPKASVIEWFAAPDYWLARVLLQRGLALIYLIAFVVALLQFPALLGERGLLPVPHYLRAVCFRRSPSLFHWRYSDRLLRIVAGTGAGIAAALLVGLGDPLPAPLTMALWLALWALYLSIVNVGQVFYGFGWETLLLEAGFLAIFLGPAWMAPPVTIVYLYRWLLFRVEFGAGLIKMRGDPCWRDLTCLYYHHETQPMPNPFSWHFHHLPRRFHRLEVLGNHFAQLVAPWLLFAPQPIASFAALVIVLTQSWLMLSGNFAWLNLITIVLAFSAFDNGFISARVHPPSLVLTEWHALLALAATALVVVLSIRPARNLVSRRQLMNASFDPLHLVNTYGAFGSITRERYEIVVEGTDEAMLLPATRWQEYEFKAKPGDVFRRPPQFAPYHLRLDWLMWFAAMGSAWSEDWFVPFVVKLLQNDQPTLRLIERNPFPDLPPHAVRARLYRYRFTTAEERRETGAWWSRTLVGEYLPPMTLRQAS